MKRLLDSLLSRWYVPNDQYETLCQSLWHYVDDEKARRDNPPSGISSLSEPMRVIITTDYQRGTPCS